MIKSGNRLRKAKEVFLQIRNEFPNSYQQVLNETYECNFENLRLIFSFFNMFSDTTGYEIIGELMKECGHLESPYVLKVFYMTKDKTLEKHVESFREGFVENIRVGSFEKLTKFMKRFNTEIVGIHRIFDLALKRLKLSRILAFVESLHAYDQPIIVDLYNVMMDQGFLEKEEHIEIAQWISAKLSWIHRQPKQSDITGNLQPILEQLRDRLPNGIRLFAFEPSVILATRNHEYLLRSDTDIGVNFKVQPDSSGRFYRFQDTKYNKAFYVEYYQDANDVRSMKVRFGSGNGSSYYWQVVPTENGEFFYLRNKQHKVYLSSNEENVCKEKHFWGSCKLSEWMNSASSSSSKWMFTDRLIRKRILPDRRTG